MGDLKSEHAAEQADAECDGNAPDIQADVDGRNDGVAVELATHADVGFAYARRGPPGESQARIEPRLAVNQSGTGIQLPVQGVRPWIRESVGRVRCPGFSSRRKTNGTPCVQRRTLMRKMFRRSKTFSCNTARYLTMTQ